MRGMKRVRYHSSLLRRIRTKRVMKPAAKWDTQVNSHALCDLADADLNNAALESKPFSARR